MSAPQTLGLDEKTAQLLESRLAFRASSSPPQATASAVVAPNNPGSVPSLLRTPPEADGSGSNTMVAIVTQSNHTSQSLEAIFDAEAKEETSSESSQQEKENRKRSYDTIETEERVNSNSRASISEEQQDGGGSRGTQSAKLASNTIDKYFTSFAGSIAPSSTVANPSFAAIDSPPGQNLQSRQVYVNMPAPAMKPSKSSKEVGPPSLDHRKELEALRLAKEQVEAKVARLEDEVSRAEELKDRNLCLSKCLEDIYRSNARQEMRRRRERLALDSVRLGKFRTIQTGPRNSIESWEDGYLMKELAQRQMELLSTKEELDRRKKRLTSQKKLVKKENGGDEYDHDIAAEEEALKAHEAHHKSEQLNLADERRLLDSEKELHKKELRRIECEDRSRFLKDLPCLSGRYQLTSILGRGGFSEVWKAFDLAERRDVAIKVHQLNSSWPEDSKQSYIKHVTREYRIHRDMKHPRVVQLFDVFEIDENSFATVMELCRGTDLDEKLKKSRVISEKDCRVIIMQILSGLKYLHSPFDGETAEQRRKAIIHYDLKPANILFDEYGDVKITDFGLSKIIDESVVGTSIDLTSQGSGTYWYLPPECSASNPIISPKVDIWSVGVIFFQMLYGRRPYGEGKSQEQVLREGIMNNPNQVDFPPVSDTSTPKVSEEAKDFIRECLTLNQELRPDVYKLCMHPYFRSRKT